ncbi:MAG: zinc transport system permease protein [Bradymonadia bacterium]|jgi:zinc transport system permease protein
MHDLHAPQDLSLFFDSWILFREPALAGAIAGALLGMLGVYVVLRRVVFLSAAVSQAAGLGVALSAYAKLHLGVTGWLASPTLGAVLLTALAVLPFIGGRAHARRDALLGAIWLLGSAGTLIIGSRIVAELSDIQDLLFGTAVAVIPADFQRLWIVAAIIGVVHLWWHRGFAAASFERDSARVRGMPTRLLDVVLFATLALAISVCTRILGALPTFAFMILPAMSALAIAWNVRSALVMAVGLGAITGFGGYLLSFRYSLPVGAAQTLLGLGLLVLVSVLGAAARMARARLA